MSRATRLSVVGITVALLCVAGPAKARDTKILLAGEPQPTPACASGLMPRLARPTDLVCVSPMARGRTARENATAARHVDPNGAYGPNSCRAGFVWREAFVGDVVCVTPQVRRMVMHENAAALARRQVPDAQAPPDGATR